MTSADKIYEADQCIQRKEFEKAKKLLVPVANEEVDVNDDDAVRTKTQAMLDLGNLYRQTDEPNALLVMIRTFRPFLGKIGKARASKVVRTLMDCFLDCHAGTGIEIDVCKENIQWATEEERSYLRQALQVRLIALYHENKMYDDALDLTSRLLRELKKIDDKHLIVDVQLLESRIYYSLGNMARSRAALTSARTTANSIYCPPKLQAALDMQSGIMHAAENDYKTAYSYFYEAFDGYNSVEDKKAVSALKYMLLCKIMMKGINEIKSVLSSKIALKYAGPEVESMKAIAAASEARSLAQFEEVVKEYSTQLSDDEVVKIQLNALYDTLFDQNLSRLIEPFSRVEIAHIAKMINRPQQEVEKKLSLMILDKRLNGILDQNSGILVLFEDHVRSNLYTEALAVVQELNKVVDVLFSRAQVI